MDVKIKQAFEELKDLDELPQTKIPDIKIPYIPHSEKIRNLMFKLKFIGNKPMSDFFYKPKKSKLNFQKKPP